MVARTERTDVVLVGGGIMSATLGVFLKELEPSWNIILLERLDKAAQESSNPWNNAGTSSPAERDLEGCGEPLRAGLPDGAERYRVLQQAAPIVAGCPARPAERAAARSSARTAASASAEGRRLPGSGS